MKTLSANQYKILSFQESMYLTTANFMAWIKIVVIKYISLNFYENEAICSNADIYKLSIYKQVFVTNS